MVPHGQTHPIEIRDQFLQRIAIPKHKRADRNCQPSHVLRLDMVVLDLGGEYPQRSGVVCPQMGRHVLGVLQLPSPQLHRGVGHVPGLPKPFRGGVGGDLRPGEGEGYGDRTHLAEELTLVGGVTVAGVLGVGVVLVVLPLGLPLAPVGGLVGLVAVLGVVPAPHEVVREGVA